MSHEVKYACPVHGKFLHRVTCGHGSGPAPQMIRCHVAGCLDIAKRNSTGGSRVNRRSLSVHKATYDRMQAYCIDQEISMEALIEALTHDLGKTS